MTEPDIPPQHALSFWLPEAQSRSHGRSTETSIYLTNQTKMKKASQTMGFSKPMRARSFLPAKQGSKTPKLCYENSLDEDGA
jgi:hypothetical protein